MSSSLSSDGTGSDMSSQADASGQNYITVIPVEYPRRVYGQPADFSVEQYREYLRERAREEYMRGDYNINSGPHFNDHGPLYTVSQRFEREQFERNREAYMAAAVAAGDAYDRGMQHQHMQPTDSRCNSDSSGSHKEELTVVHHKGRKSRMVHVCIFLMSPVAVHLELENGSHATVQELMQHILVEPEISLPPNAANIFTLWMYSPLLELQLKPHHKPLQVRKEWPYFLARFTKMNEQNRVMDEPILSLQRNVFFSKKDELKINDLKVLELLYEEAKFNVLGGRYPCEQTDYIMLGSIQARLELGPYNPQVHTADFFKEHAHRFLPRHVCRPNVLPFTWLRMTSKTSPEVRLLEQFHRIPSSTAYRKLIKRYLEFCWALPFYGAAFFWGQVERPVKGLSTLFNHKDLIVLVAINEQGIYLINTERSDLLLGLKYDELSWDFAKPSQEINSDCLPCLFLQFVTNEYGRKVSKIVQVFSRQAAMMDALISSFVDDLKQVENASYAPSSAADNGGNSSTNEGQMCDASTEMDEVLLSLSTVTRREAPADSCLSNKLDRLTLATFDEDVRNRQTTVNF